MNRILEVCLAAATLATTLNSAAARPAAEAQNPAQSSPAAQGSPALQRGISVQMPITGNALPMPEADNPDAWIVTVTADGNLDFGIDPVSPEALLEEMKSRPRNREQKLYIKADARAPYADVEEVLAAAHVDLFESSVLLTSQKDSSAPGTMVSPKGLEVLLGPSSTAGKVATVVQVLNSGQHMPSLKINGDQIPWPALQSTLRQHFEKGDDRLILIKADGQLPFADIVRVIDACQSAGAKVVLPTPQL